MMEMTKHTQNDPQSQEKENVTQENLRHMEKIGMVQHTRCQNRSSWILVKTIAHTLGKTFKILMRDLNGR